MTDEEARRLGDALAYATWLHRGQQRKATPIPYVSHLLGVSSIVLEHGGSTNEAIAGVLHDAVEDQGGQATLDHIRERFGDEVGAIVLGCTDGAPGEARDASTWRSRKQVYLAHLPRASASVILVSAADKLYNARSILRDLRDQGGALWSRFRGGRDGTLWYYHSLAGAFRACACSTPEHRRLFDELERTIAAIDALA
jgi:GTP pyrophosphokinase